MKTATFWLVFVLKIDIVRLFYLMEKCKMREFVQKCQNKISSCERKYRGVLSVFVVLSAFGLYRMNEQALSPWIWWVLVLLLIRWAKKFLTLWDVFLNVNQGKHLVIKCTLALLVLLAGAAPLLDAESQALSAKALAISALMSLYFMMGVLSDGENSVFRLHQSGKPRQPENGSRDYFAAHCSTNKPSGE